MSETPKEGETSEVVRSLRELRKSAKDRKDSRNMWWIWRAHFYPFVVMAGSVSHLAFYRRGWPDCLYHPVDLHAPRKRLINRQLPKPPCAGGALQRTRHETLVFKGVEGMYSLMQRITKYTTRFFASKSDRVVNFLICGTQKGGTSALDAYLREHPEICMVDKKESHFFDNESVFCKITPDYSKYHSFFNPKSSHQLLGETTPIYMYWHDSPRRIWQYNPHMKIIVILRNPIDRAYSHWNMERSRKTDDLPFWDAIQNEQERCREALPYQHRVYSYIDRGFYLEQLRRLWFYFSKDNVLVLKNEYLKNQPQEALQDVCDFLGVDRFAGVATKDVHSRPYPSQMSDKEREYLRFVFEHEIRGIERVLGWDCSDWLSK